jgi:hypothetical protein
MRQDVKDLADAMEAGWNKVPRMSNWYFSIKSHDMLRSVIRNLHGVEAACAQGHALIGKGVLDADQRHTLFPILRKQTVQVRPTCTGDLEYAINTLVMNEGWTTPQVVAWLRTHEQD